MADYIYLLESRLSPAQQKALQTVRELARAKGLTVFLVGGAVRDLTNGSPVRDLDVVVQGNALKLKKDLEKSHVILAGEQELMQTLYLRFPDGVRMSLESALSVHYPKPGKPVVKPANILEDLRRRDFTANAMALSLNEGSYGLLMDPLNGVADIENREIRLVSNYGFIEDPIRMIRAVRFAARLGWQMEEKTRARYETGKEEGYISAMSDFQRGYELEELVYEEDPLRVLQRLETEGWMKHLCAAWTTGKVNTAELEKLRETQTQLQMRGIVTDLSASQFPLLTAKMQPKDVASLKKSFPRVDLVHDIDSLEAEGKKFAAELSSKAAATPSAAWKMILAARPEIVLWAAYSTKSPALQTKFKNFYTEWPQARQKIPYSLMQEMRIVSELPGYDELVEKLFFELMDGNLSTVEEMKAYLEPFSPPAPPPPVHLRRARATRKEGKGTRSRKKPSAEETTAEDGSASVEEDGISMGHEGDSDQQAEITDKAVEVLAPKAAAGKSVEAKAPRSHAKSKPPKKAGLAKTAVKAAPAKTKPIAAKKSAKTQAKAPAKKAAPQKAAKPKAKSTTVKSKSHSVQSSKAKSTHKSSKPAASKSKPAVAKKSVAKKSAAKKTAKKKR